MADYRFDKPWAAESQNVQDFTEQEWETGIVEKSLVSSSQVNGVMQAVTKRFLDLEAVEDRQYRYDFVIENQAEWNKFINGNLGNAQSVLIRKGQVWTAANAVTLRRVGVVALEEGAEIRFNNGLTRQSLSPAILSGGVIRGDLTNCRVLYATVTATLSAIYENTVFENSYVYTESSTVSLSRGHYSRSVINTAGKIMNAKLTDCKINNVKELDNCTIVRCEIPTNTKLTDCTVIDCDYLVNLYTENLVTGTTFRNCYLILITNTSDSGAVCDATNKAYGSKIKFNLNQSEHVSMLIYDSEIIYNSLSFRLSLFSDSKIYGASYIDMDGKSDFYLTEMLDEFSKTKGSLLTSIPFFKKADKFYTYISTDTVYPGVINIINNTMDRTTLSSLSKQKYYIRYGGSVSSTQIKCGNFRFAPWCEYLIYSNTDDSYNIEFINPA